MNWLNNIVSSLASVGWPTVAGVGSILVVVILLFFYMRSDARKKLDEARLKNEADTYHKLSEALRQRKQDLDELMDKMKKDRDSR